jgi:hypothetical protein
MDQPAAPQQASVPAQLHTIGDDHVRLIRGDVCPCLLKQPLAENFPVQAGDREETIGCAPVQVPQSHRGQDLGEGVAPKAEEQPEHQERRTPERPVLATGGTVRQ